MIQVQKENTIKTSGVITSMTAGIKQEGMSIIANLLRSQIYEDSILATIRETVCNSVDANIAAGNGSKPVEVTLPTRFNPVFKTKDSGKGLSDQDMEDIYLWYGCSTKRDSNDFTGCLGIGRFAPLSYTTSFTVTSCMNGTKNIFNVFIDSSDNNQIAKIHSEPTKEPNGVEISVAVKDVDIEDFNNKANYLFRYFKVKPLVNRLPLKYDAVEPIFSGSDWKILGNQRSVAIMGNVGYPIDNHFNDNPAIFNTLNCGIEIDFKIGDLDISASREGLKYNDRTKASIRAKFANIIDEVSKELNHKFKSCNTLYDARKLYGEVFNYGSQLYPLRDLVKSSLTFDGKPVTSNRFAYNLPTNGSFTVKHYEKAYHSHKIRSSDAHSFECNIATMLIDNDLKISSGIVNRVHTAVNAGKDVYLLSYATPAGKAEFLQQTGLVDSNFVKLSSLPKIVLANTSGTPITKNNKHSSKEFIFDFDYAQKASSWNRKYSDFWKKEDVDVDNDSGLYVIIDKFQVENQNNLFVEPQELRNLAKSMKTFGINIGKVYGFKMKHKDALKKNKGMVNLFTYINTELVNYFNQNKIAQKVSDRVEYDKHADDWTSFMLKNINSANAKTVFFKNASILQGMESKKDKVLLDEAVKFKQYFSLVNPSHDVAKLKNEFTATYPLIQYISIWSSENDPQKTKAVMQYVNLIDG